MNQNQHPRLRAITATPPKDGAAIAGMILTEDFTLLAFVYDGDAGYPGRFFEELIAWWNATMAGRPVPPQPSWSEIFATARAEIDREMAERRNPVSFARYEYEGPLRSMVTPGELDVGGADLIQALDENNGYDVRVQIQRIK